MKNSVPLVVAAIAGVVVLGGAALTNPGPEAYSRFVGALLGDRLKSEGCQELAASSRGFLQQQIQNQCPALIDRLSPQLGSLVAPATERQNLIFFSLYHSRVDLNPLIPPVFGARLPTYEIASVGIAGQFIPYRVGRS